MHVNRFTRWVGSALAALLFASFAFSQGAVQIGSSLIAPQPELDPILAIADSSWDQRTFDISNPRQAHPARLVNVSARARVGASEPLIAGASIRGAGTLPTLVRAIGPGLAAYGVGDTLPAPKLTVYSSERMVAESTTVANAAIPVAAYVGAFPARDGTTRAADRDAAILGRPGTGLVTAHCSSVNARPGVALVEFYDSDSAPSAASAHFINLSARARVEPNEGVIVIGFVVKGHGSLRLLLRGVGKSLTNHGVSDVLSDPTIRLYSGSTLIASNNDWKQNATTAATELVEAASSVGAFPLTSDSDAALIVTLTEGTYTLHVGDASGQSGQAIGEIYELGEARAFDFARSTNLIGLDLFRQLLASDSSPNTIISPYSIETALALAYVGATADTRLEMARVLRLPEDNASLQAGYAALREAMKKLADDSAIVAENRRKMGSNYEPIQWTLANRLFGQEGYPFRDTFLATLSDGFGAPVQRMDFIRQPDPSRVLINTWVEEQTRNKITDLLPPESINTWTRFVLVNALYLKANWDSPFEKGLTASKPFAISPTVSVDVPTMRRMEHLGHSTESGRTIVTLDYIGNALQFVIILPAAGESVDAAAAALTADDFARWSRLARERPAYVSLALPKFKVKSASLPVGKALAALGMETAFTDRANFDGIVPRTTHTVALAEVYHKTYVAVDEEGTEAAAATAVIGRTTALPAVPIEVRVDRPFLFLIQQKESGACLFIGKVSDPR